MEKCTIAWRPSGGRGEYEFVPSKSLIDRDIVVAINELGIQILTEVRGTISQSKARLRKHEANNRGKLHLIPLVMAIARLPSPAREDKSGSVSWPLKSKKFIASHLNCKIISDDGRTIILEPSSLQILHSNKIINLTHRFQNMRQDIDNLNHIRSDSTKIADSIEHHWKLIQEQKNSSEIQQISDQINTLQVGLFGDTNFSSIMTAKELPHTDIEENITGKEGRILTRLHSFRERNQNLIRVAKELFKKKHGRIFCECCGIELDRFYGERGQDRIQAHHRIPMEELLPDSETRPEDLAMVCPNCHCVIHAKRPWITVENLKGILLEIGSHYFNGRSY